MQSWSQEQTVASYLNTFPEVRQWVTHCPACGRYGAHPDAPYKDFKVGTQRFFARTLKCIMPLSESGLCEACTAAIELGQDDFSAIHELPGTDD
jgi:hypothetical protein